MAKDIYHNIVREALEQEGWVITHDPYYLILQKDTAEYEIDLGAEKLLAAEKGNDKIAIEVKSLLKPSLLHEFHSVLGQYMIYRYGLGKKEPERKLYLAIPDFTRNKIAKIQPLLDMIQDFNIKIIYFDDETKKIMTWEK